ncbi:RecB family exonuclease [Nocardia acididurans]|uniref:RecB family exonuclease n=1 Tax=Nocardia acididurans TaxID=2802282 RepID=UPI001E309FDE|nr:RecB family exonuclease [Nocardia acididurans]
MHTPESAGTAPRKLALSPSRAIDFKQCPLKYRLRAIDRIPEPPSRAAVRGTLVHAVLEDLFGLPASDRDFDRAVTLIAPAWARLLASRAELTDLIAPEELEGFLTEARDLVSIYFRLEDPSAFDPESCEAFIEAELPEGVPLRGFVDRLDRSPAGDLHVIDYKTGRAPGPDHEMRAMFQLKFYALVLLHSLGTPPAQLRLLYLTDGQTLTYEPDADELRRFERVVAALWTAISTAAHTGDFPPSRSWMCQYCDFKALCPEFGGTPPPYPADGADRAVQLSLVVEHP